MFVVSVKAGKKRLFLALAAVLLVITLVLAASKLQSNGGTAKNGPAGETNAQRVTFLQSFGWEVVQEPIEYKDVSIPAQFDDVYQNYNAIQLAQGMDLLPFAGKTCREWVYTVTNYPNYESIRATLLVFDGKIVGGDLSDPALSGFMCGFSGQGGCDVSQPVQDPSSTGTASVSSDGSAAQTDAAPASSGSAEAPEAASQQAAAQTNGEVQPTPEIPANAWPSD